MACFGAEEASIIARDAANRWLGERNKDLWMLIFCTMRLCSVEIA